MMFTVPLYVKSARQSVTHSSFRLDRFFGYSVVVVYTSSRIISN